MRGREILLMLLGVLLTTPHARAESLANHRTPVEGHVVTPAEVGPGTPPESALSRTVTNFSGVAGTFITLGLLGFGLVLFGKTNLEIVSDTASHSFLRSWSGSFRRF